MFGQRAPRLFLRAKRRGGKTRPCVECFLELARARKVFRISAGAEFAGFRFEKRHPLSCAPRKGQRSAGPLPGAARHFAFSETGRAGHTQCVCCFAPEIRCAHFGAALANPAPSVPLKNTNSNANNWRICVFLNASLRWPRTPTANKVAFSVRARNSKNDIRALRRFAPAGKRDFEKGTVTGAPEGKHSHATALPVARCGKCELS